MQLIIGLGNPGKKYEKTRHNAGFMMLDRIKENYKFPDFEFNKKFDTETSISASPPLPPGEDVRRTGEGETKKENKILLAKPQTMMNNSGQAVKAILDFYKLPPENLIVIHDDIDIEIGKYKISADSGSAGHNGVQDIVDKISTQNFKRIRVGVANEKLRSQIDPTDFVLQKFSDEELKTLIDEVSGNILFEMEKLIK
jgi:peptidyl-tRNA hydrolase, PTH1 family